MDNLRNIIRQIIKEESEFQTDFGDKEKAKKALISLSKGLIPINDISTLHGKLSDDFPEEESGSYTQEGEIEIIFNFEGEKYTTIFDIEGSYYYREGWGGDYMQPADPGEYSDEEVNFYADEIMISDQDDNEYDFTISEFGPNFRTDLEKFLIDFYDPSQAEISK